MGKIYEGFIGSVPAGWLCDYCKNQNCNKTFSEDECKAGNETDKLAESLDKDPLNVQFRKDQKRIDELRKKRESIAKQIGELEQEHIYE
jgi:hypothetical protein